MASGGGVSGVGVATIAGGVLLIYSGVQGVTPVAALKQVLSGGPLPLPTGGTLLDTTVSGVGGAVADATNTYLSINGAGGVKLVAAVQQFRNDRYSQARRWEQGFSDCSSFVGKGFKALGIKPPGLSVTGNYLVWGALSKVPRDQVVAGDLCVNLNHMIIATSRTEGIGQENSRDNVQTGSIENLMSGTGSFVCLRYHWPTVASGGPNRKQVG